MPASFTTFHKDYKVADDGVAVVPKILFLTHADSGQANVQLSVIHALSTRQSGRVEVHLASFSDLSKRCPKDVFFHTVQGKSMRETDTWIERLQDPTSNTPSLRHLITTARSFIPTLIPYTPEEYIQTAKSIEQLVSTLKPDYVIIDTLFQQAIDAVEKLGNTPFCLLSPNTVKDLAMQDQGAKLMSFPILGTGLSFPIPCYLQPLNLAAAITLQMTITSSCPFFSSLMLARAKAGYDTILPLLDPRPDIVTMCVSTEGFDYPMIVPKRLKCCGPILPLPSPPPVGSSPLRASPLDPSGKDAELVKWLNKPGRQTVMLAFGTHFKVDEEYANKLYTGIENLLKKKEGLQVLWKLVKHGKYPTPGFSSGSVYGWGSGKGMSLSMGSGMGTGLGMGMGMGMGKGMSMGMDSEKEMVKKMQGKWGDRLKVVDWLDIEPIDLLRSGKVVGVVHHGGSNSYHEALAAGVPQVIMSAWLDCHEFGPRAEYLGVGVWGNKNSAPGICSDEFTKALTAILGWSTSYQPSTYAVRADEVRRGIEAATTSKLVEMGVDKVEGKGGRDLAAAIVWQEVGKAIEARKEAEAERKRKQIEQEEEEEQWEEEERDDAATLVEVV